MLASSSNQLHNILSDLPNYDNGEVKLLNLKSEKGSPDRRKAPEQTLKSINDYKQNRRQVEIYFQVGDQIVDIAINLVESLLDGEQVDLFE